MGKTTVVIIPTRILVVSWQNNIVDFKFGEYNVKHCSFATHIICTGFLLIFRG